MSLQWKAPVALQWDFRGLSAVDFMLASVSVAELDCRGWCCLMLESHCNIVLMMACIGMVFLRLSAPGRGLFCTIGLHGLMLSNA